MQVLKYAAKFVGNTFVLELLKRGAGKIVDKGVDSGAKKFDGSRRRYGGEVKLSAYKDLPKLDLPAGYFFIVRDGSDPKRHRFGTTGNPHADIEKLKRETPYEITVAALIKCSNVGEFERALSKRFKKKRERAGRWYKLKRSDLRAIDNFIADKTDE